MSSSAVSAQLRATFFKLVVSTFAITLGGVLVSSAVAHLGNPYFFLSTVYRYNLLPHAPAYLLAVWLPYLQLVVGCCLLFDWFRPAAFFISAGMVAIFLCAQVAVLLSGNSMSCGCFGPRFDSPVGLTSVITLSVVLVGIILALVEKSSEGVRLG